MSEELLINVTPQETCVARVENGVLTEVLIERKQRSGMIGNIYKGTVKRVLPGMEAAFVDIGLERAAFLHASDIAGAIETQDGERTQKHINQLLSEGDEIGVQVIKDPLGSKGARISSNLTAPARLLVMMPFDSNIGISIRIDEEEERERLREMIEGIRQDCKPGYIVRTAAEGSKLADLEQDHNYLLKVWQTIQDRLASADAGDLVFTDLNIVLRTIRDLDRLTVERIRIDSRETYQHCQEFATEFLPEILPLLEHYPGERPIFDLYGIEGEIDRALGKKVMLKSGGHLVIDQTESMTTIDVNTGAYVGHRNLEETIFKTNLEAAQTIARQLRLRNLGGIIILDFIDMTVDEHKRQVMRMLERSLERDPARTQVCEVSSLGLVEMTRKRTRESLEQLLCSNCTTCDGRGMIKTAETVCFEISREIIRQVRQFEIKSLTVLASPEVVELFTEDRSSDLAELEEFVGLPIRLQGEQVYTREQFDVVLL